MGGGTKLLSDNLERYRWAIAAIFAVPLLSGVILLVNDRLRDPEPPIFDTSLVAATDIRVYIAGAVANPGVYPLADGDRWIDALEAAGGATGDANLEAINLSRRVKDEDQIVVPRAGTAVAGAGSEPLVDINTASEFELMSLPGIGEVRARNIVNSRVADGPFLEIEDLTERRLIPASVFEDIVSRITIR